MDILIIKLGALGDVINVLPLAVLLKKQLGARIHWLVEPLSYPIVAHHDAVQRAILFDRSKGCLSIAHLLHGLRSQQFDMVLDLQRILKSGLIGCAVRGERKLGFDRRRCKEVTWLLPFERIAAADPGNHMVHQYLEFARHLGLTEEKVRWEIKAPLQRLEGLPRRFVVLNIGATKAANRWTAQGFAALAQLIYARHALPCVLTGGREDLLMSQSIQDLAGDVVHNRVGRTGLMELIGLLDAAHAVVTCDTGPMHLAVALGKIVIALFGPSDHRRTGPFRGKVLRAKVDCAPCRRKHCANPVCMTAIRAEAVLDVLSAELNSNRK